LYANLMTFVASLLKLEFAPFMTTWVSFLLASLPAIVIFKLPLRTQVSTTWRTVIGFGLLFLPAVTEPDIFANSLQMQVHFGVLAAVLILVDFSQLETVFILCMLPPLLIVALSGTHAAVIGTVMFFSTVFLQVDRKSDSERWAQRDLKRILVGSVFFVGFIVQVLVFLANRSALQADLTHHRGRIPSSSAIATYVASNFSTIFSGRVLTERVLERPGLRIFGILSLFFLAALFFSLVHSSWKSSRKQFSGSRETIFRRLSFLQSEIHVQLAVTYCVIVFVTLFGFVSPLPNARYQTVPSVVLFLIVTLSVSEIGSKIITSTFVTLLGASSVVGLAYDPWEFLTCRAPCIEWLTQTREVNEGVRTRFEFWPLHASPTFDAPAKPPSNWCDDFNALVSWKCEE